MIEPKFRIWEYMDAFENFPCFYLDPLHTACAQPSPAVPSPVLPTSVHSLPNSSGRPRQRQSRGGPVEEPLASCRSFQADNGEPTIDVMAMGDGRHVWHVITYLATIYHTPTGACAVFFSFSLTIPMVRTHCMIPTTCSHIMSHALFCLLSFYINIYISFFDRRFL